MNVDCAKSEKFYGLNDLIGNGLSMTDFMSQTKEMISFPQKMSNNNRPGTNNRNNPKQGPNRYTYIF